MASIWYSVGHKVVYDAQSRVEAKFSSVILNGEWYWRFARFDDLVEIQARLHEVRLDLYDKPIWTASRKGVYVSAETWELLREKREEAVWWKLVWLLSQSKLLFFGWLYKTDLAQMISCLSGATQGMLNAYFAITKLKVEIIYFLMHF